MADLLLELILSGSYYISISTNPSDSSHLSQTIIYLGIPIPMKSLLNCCIITGMRFYLLDTS